MKTFYCELHVGNTDFTYFYELQAKDLNEAMQLVRAYCAGWMTGSSIKVELRSIGMNKARGKKYEVLF